MRQLRPAFALGLTAVLLFNIAPIATACGPSYVLPVYVMEKSPDPPFTDFTQGNIGILQPTFGRKTLVIAYRYLTGGTFNADEQKALIEALHGKPPEENGSDALKAWVLARQKLLMPDEKLPEIYVERQNSGYDFFPNCSENAFEVAKETLADRVSSYGAEDKDVRTWLTGQDTVFKNCASGSHIPQELGAESPQWLRKDRDYQIGAALFYSLEFDRARAQFERIATDTESPWRETADYLVGRTLVRQASLVENPTQRNNVYQLAEIRLQSLMRGRGKFSDAAQKLQALVKYRLRPEERVVELSQVLSQQNANENLRQDLIDYVWLIRKIESKVLREEAKRKEALTKREGVEQPEAFVENEETRTRSERIQQGKTIVLTLYLKGPEGNPDYSKGIAIDFNADTPEAEVMQAFEVALGKKLSDDETNEVRRIHQSALSHREYLIAPNRKWQASQDEDTYYTEDELTFDLVPGVLRLEDLSDWILTLEVDDAKAYSHAFRRWRTTQSTHWLLAALVKANSGSPQVERLMRQAELVKSASSAFPTLVFHLARLKTSLGKRQEARTLLDEALSSSESLPRSSRNLLLEQRLNLSTDLNEFLRFASRAPIGFYEDGRYGRMKDLMEEAKRFWNSSYRQTKEEYERETEENYKDLLPWDDRAGFDEKTTDVFNWHFSTAQLAEVARNPELPENLQRELALAVWTRAVVLKNDPVAQKIAPQIPKLAPEMAAIFDIYLKARSSREREFAALNVLLQFPNLSPLVTSGPPVFRTAANADYYLETAWWCPPSNLEYTREGNEVAKVVPTFNFLTPKELGTARRERAALIAVGDAKSYLGKKVLEWARIAPDDPRVPEALYIAAQANSQYKYGCNSWEFDEKTKQAAERILRQRYPGNPWTAKLDAPE